MQNTVQNVAAVATAPALAAVIGDSHYALGFALVAVFPLLAIPLTPVRAEREKALAGVSRRRTPVATSSRVTSCSRGRRCRRGQWSVRRRNISIPVASTSRAAEPGHARSSAISVRAATYPRAPAPAEDRGFEPLRDFPQPAFQSSAIGH